jgi:hypothetical protein
MTKPGAMIVREIRQALPAFLFFFVAFHMISWPNLGAMRALGAYWEPGIFD